MSQWRIAIRALHAAGKPMSVQQIETATDGSISATKAMREAQKLGMAVSKGRGWNATWTLTDIGVGWCEDRYRVAYPSRDNGNRRGKKVRVFATWLTSLPRDIRLDAGRGVGV